VVVQPAGIPLKVWLLSPSGTEVMTFLNESGDQKPLTISYVASDTGTMTLEFTLTDPDARAQTLFAAPGRAPSRNPRRSQANRSAARVSSWQSPANRRSEAVPGQALARFEAALALWRSLGDKVEESHTLDTISDVYIALGDNPKAVDTLTRALSLARAAGDRPWRPTSLPILASPSLSAIPKKP